MANVETVPAEYVVSFTQDEWDDLQSVFRKATGTDKDRSVRAIFGPVGNLYNSQAQLAMALFGDDFF